MCALMIRCMGSGCASTDELIESHLWVAKRAVFSIRGVFDDDLYQEAVIGLIRAARRYEPEKGPFMNFAIKRVNGAIKDAIGREMKHKSRATHFDVAFHDRHGDSDVGGFTAGLLAAGFVSLSERDREIVRRRLAGETLKEIGLLLGISEARCSQVFSKFVRQVRAQAA